jgi:hypothetical protein
MKRGLCAAAVLTVLLGVDRREAQATYRMLFNGGPMKNLTVDIIFWGDFCGGDPSCPGRADTLDYVNQLTQFLRGGGGDDLQGFEPAVHYYGVSGIHPGVWVAGPQSVAPYGPGSVFTPGLDQVSAIVAAARRGDYGRVHDFNGNDAGPSLPSGSNRLPIVVSEGIPYFDDYATDCGFHDSTNGSPYAAVVGGDHDCFAHEVFEALTDPTVSAPVVFNAPGGWSNLDTTAASFKEVSDQCELVNYDGVSYPLGNGTVASPGFNIWNIATVTVNSPFALNNYQYTSCQLFIPAQHAAMAASFGYGGNGTVPLFVYYVDRNGHVQYEAWWSAGAAGAGPYDLGQPSPGVTAIGKPSLVFLNYNMYVFVKGSDGAVWMNFQNTWTSLGGVIFGDPTTVVWTWGGSTWIHVNALGTDDALWMNGINNGVSNGWGRLDTGGTSFIQPPTAVSQGPDSLDMFAVGEDGQLKWLKYRSGSWAAPVTISHDYTMPFVSTPAVKRVGANGLEVIDISTSGLVQGGIFQTSYDGSSWSGFTDGQFQIPPDDVKWGFQGSPAVVVGSAGRVDVFAVARSGKVWWFDAHAEPHGFWQTGTQAGAFRPPPLVSGGATGDPVALSRAPGQLELFYRTTNGQLAHLTGTNITNTSATWTRTPEIVLAPNSIR